MDGNRAQESEQAELVADLATTLFDATGEIHASPASDRFVLETAALLGGHLTKEAPEPMAGQPAEVQRLLAATLAHYHGDEPPVGDPAEEGRARTLAALLRIAAALRTLSLDLVIASPDRLELYVQGPDIALGQVQEATDLWSELYGQPVQVVAGPARHELSARLLGAPALRSEMPFDLAVRAVLDYYLGQTLESRATSPDEVLALHRTIQGARRVFRMMSEQLDVTEVASIPKHLRWLSKTVRPVRQWHAIILNAEGYLETTEGRLEGVEALLQTWHGERAQAMDEAQRALNSARYRELETATGILMRSRTAGIFGKGTPRQPLYCVLPSMIWEYYQRLRALEPTTQPPTTRILRAIRGQARDLYQLMAQYQSVLGPSGATSVRSVQGLEESLTFFADLHRTIRAANDYLKDDKEMPVAGVRAFIDALKSDRETWLGRWPRAWKSVTSLRFRRSLGRAVAEL
jgi:CHAD domain-containing protein